MARGLGGKEHGVVVRLRTANLGTGITWAARFATAAYRRRLGDISWPHDVYRATCLPPTLPPRLHLPTPSHHPRCWHRSLLYTKRTLPRITCSRVSSPTPGARCATSPFPRGLDAGRGVFRHTTSPARHLLPLYSSLMTLPHRCYSRRRQARLAPTERHSYHWTLTLPLLQPLIPPRTQHTLPVCGIAAGCPYRFFERTRITTPACHSVPSQIVLASDICLYATSDVLSRYHACYLALARSTRTVAGSAVDVPGSLSSAAFCNRITTACAISSSPYRRCVLLTIPLHTWPLTRPARPTNHCHALPLFRLPSTLWRAVTLLAMPPDNRLQRLAAPCNNCTG